MTAQFDQEPRGQGNTHTQSDSHGRSDAHTSEARSRSDANSQPGPGGRSDDDRSLADLLSTLMSQLSTLFRKEIELARTEVQQQVQRAAKAAGAFGGAAGAAVIAVLLLSFALAWGLAEFLPVWAGFLIVGVVYAVIAGVLFAGGKKKAEQINPKPEQTIETLKEDAEWAKSRKS